MPHLGPDDLPDLWHDHYQWLAAVFAAGDCIEHAEARAFNVVLHDMHDLEQLAPLMDGRAL